MRETVALEGDTETETPPLGCTFTVTAAGGPARPRESVARYWNAAVPVKPDAGVKTTLAPFTDAVHCAAGGAVATAYVSAVVEAVV